MAALDLSPGAVIGGDFRIERPLGKGGMGSLFVVEQISTGNRRALKLMHSSFVDDPGLRERFQQEARVGSRIESDHVVQVVAAGVDAGTGTPWLAMELLEGEDLAAFAKRRGGAPISEVLAIFDQLGHALGAAHAAGVVHRDLKPENVFLARARRADGGFVVKVLDFGIAKVLDDARRGSSTTAAIGTPLWMAPEQSEAHAHVGPATDVWPLGLIAFYVLTGKKYWKNAKAQTSSLLREILLEPLDLPSVRAAELGVAEKIPAGFDAWFVRCVARDPAARFPDGHSAVAALREAIAAPAAVDRTVFAAPVAADVPAERTQPGAPAAIEAAIQGQTQPGAPPILDTPAGGFGQPTIPRRPAPGKPAPMRLVLVGAVVVAALAGAGFLGRGLFSGKDTTSKPASSASASASASASVAPAAPEKNRWIPVRPPAAPVLLGVSDDKALPDVSGFRPSRRIMAPMTPYEIQQHEVTWEEMDAWIAEDASRAFPRPSWVPADAPARARLPATGVPWETARAFCRALGGSLPTEEEWEFAARGPERRPYAWGSQRLDLERTRAYTRRFTGGVPVVAVGTMEQDQTPAEAGSEIVDLMGNALEWTADVFREDRPKRDESWADDGTTTFRAVRGLPLDKPPPRVLPVEGAAVRQSLCASGSCPKATAEIRENVGFRCARKGKRQ